MLAKMDCCHLISLDQVAAGELKQKAPEELVLLHEEGREDESSAHFLDEMVPYD